MKLMFAATPVNKHPIRFPVAASYKLDGNRAACYSGRTWTRSSKEVPNTYAHKLLSRWEGLDGEFILGSPTDELVFNRTDSAFRTGYGEPDFTYYAFDLVDQPDLTFVQRYAVLKERAAYYNAEEVKAGRRARIVVLEQRIINSMEELLEFYQEALNAGYEGLILKRLDAKYKHGKATPLSQEQVKLKPHEDSEAQVEGFEEQKTNNNIPFLNEMGLQTRSTHAENMVLAGTLGKLLVRDIYTGVRFKLSCGKMSHADRLKVWRNREQYLRAIATYRFFPIGVLDKPRMNRFYRWRDLVDIDLTKAKFLLPK